MTPDERSAELEPEVAALRAHVQELLVQNQHVQARLAKASHNSSKPPSSDPVARKRPRSQRRHSGKKPGGQLGHSGETLHLVATPDELVEHQPAVCGACQISLDPTAPVVLYERRTVHELPAVRLLVREQGRARGCQQAPKRVTLCALRCREPVACRLLLQLTLARLHLGVQKTWIEHGVCSCAFGDGASEPREGAKGAKGPAAAAIANGERPAPGRCGQFHGVPSRVGSSRSSWCGTIRRTVVHTPRHGETARPRAAQFASWAVYILGRRDDVVREGRCAGW